MHEDSKSVENSVKNLENKDLYRTLFENIDDGFVLVEPIFNDNGNSDDYIMLKFNKTWERQTGLNATEFLGKHIKEVMPEVESIWPQKFAKVAKTGNSTHFESYNQISDKWYDLYAFPYKKEQVGVLFKDITIRKKAEDALKKSEERFRAVQDNSLDRFTILKPFYNDQGEIIDFTFVYQNAMAAKTSGRRPEELIGIRMIEVWPTFPQTRFFEMYKCAVETGQVTEFEDHYHADGVDDWFYVTVTPIPDGIAIATQIITERKKTEEALKKSEALYRAVAKHLPHTGVYVFDQNLRFLLVEGQGLALPVGFTNKKSLEGRTVFDLDKQTREIVEPRYRRVLAGESFHYETNYHSQIIRTDYVPIFDEDGKVVLGMAIPVDITEQKEAENALVESEERYRSLYQILFNSIDEGFCIFEVLFDDSGKAYDLFFHETNSRYEEESGLKNVVGKTMCEIVPEIEPFWMDIYTNVTITGESKRFEDYVEAMGKWFDIFAFRIGEPSEHKVGALFRNVTERKNAEKQLKEAINELKRSNEELEQFAYVSSHDLQEPLRTIASFTQLLEKRYKGKFDSDADEFMDYIVEASIRMKEQIEGLLEYSRVGTKGEEFKHVNINVIVNKAIHSLNTSIKETSANIKVDELPEVMGDENQLQRVFQNLISNAIKFKKQEEPPKIHIFANKDIYNKEYVFSVQDNGIGIEEQYSERIFTIFQRLHTRDVYEGTGIGLSIVKRIIERHGGHIWVESEFGVGSTFYFTLSIK
ncbi:ATP-binding protein [Methanobacterium sp.]|uniref:PAS domain-containing sensor histidine kinase n=1 Tax=Methanobacterium sp. TaxID=2164 RepID=UPI003C78B3E9